MQFKVDENLPVEVAGLRRKAGHGASTVMEEGLQGRPDSEIPTVRGKAGLVLITLDVGFSDIPAYLPAEAPGMVVLRLRSQDKSRVLEAVKRFLSLLGFEQLRIAFGLSKKGGFV